MAVVQIFELDSNDPVTTLEAGEYVFGRGPLLQCNDRRVSRNHGVIKITGMTATISSTHHNPCFYQAANSSTITILAKNNPVGISDGDKFALLADQFWFRIKITNGSSDSGRTNGNLSLQRVNLSSNNDENGRLSPLSFTSAPASSDMNDIQNNSDFLQTTQAGQEAEQSSVVIPEPNKNDNEDADNINDDDSSDSIDFLQAPQKRVHEPETESPNKKAKFDDEKETEENELLSVLGDLKNEGENSNKEVTSKPEGQTIKEVMSEVEDEDNIKETTSKEEDKKEIMSESEDDNINVKVKPDTPKKNPYKWKKENTSVLSAASSHDAELKSMLFSSDEDNENQANNLNVEATASSSSKNNNKNKDIKLNINNGSTATNKDKDKNEKRDSKDNDTDKNDKANEDPNAPGTSGSNKKKQRDHCWYGLECYRKSASHLGEYSHPGDSDYETDPEDDRPICAFGAACYRRNKDHRQAYRHPNKPQKPPGTGKRPKKKNNKAGTPKKRTSRKKYDQSSEEDDYDLQDPFLCDSGTEYEATTSDEDDSDSDWSRGSEEETKRLLKEAKKFTRGKKKDKNDDD